MTEKCFTSQIVYNALLSTKLKKDLIKSSAEGSLKIIFKDARLLSDILHKASKEFKELNDFSIISFPLPALISMVIFPCLEYFYTVQKSGSNFGNLCELKPIVSA